MAAIRRVFHALDPRPHTYSATDLAAMHHMFGDDSL